MLFQSLPDVIRCYLKAYQAMDIDTLIDCLTDDVMFLNSSNHAGQMDLRGKERFRDVAERSAAAFSTRSQEVQDLVADEAAGRYAISILFQGTLAVDMGDDLKAGETMMLRGVSFMTVRDGRISQITDFS